MPTSPITNSVFTAGSLPALAIDSAAIRQQLDGLSRQIGNGRVADSYGGLASHAATVSLTYNVALSQTETWQANVTAADGRMRSAQSALTQISDIASTFYAQSNVLNGLSSVAVDATAASARDALRQMAGLLDTRFGDTYVFAGTDTATPPIPSPDAILTSGFYVGISSAVGLLSTSGATATLATTLAGAASNAVGLTPFSASLSRPAATLGALRPVVQIDTNRFLPTGILASANADVTSTGTSTTGSYMRDIMRALATIGSLTSSQISDPGFATVVHDTQASLGDAIAALNSDAGVLGNRQASMTATSQRLDDTRVALKSQISDAQDIDMADALSRLTAVQTRLQASYRMLSMVQSMSLVNFLR